MSPFPEGVEKDFHVLASTYQPAGITLTSIVQISAQMTTTLSCTNIFTWLVADLVPTSGPRRAEQFIARRRL